MKETKFITDNKDKWAKFERSWSSIEQDPEELARLYMDVNEDLGYAQTFYKRRTVRVYLNKLAQEVFTGVHKHRNASKKSWFKALTIDLPLEIYRARKTIGFTLVAFLIYALIGVITTHFNVNFPRMVMGDAYVEQTLQNIANGNPLAIYQDDNAWSMFIRITSNNIGVAFLTFFAGVFLTIGTHILLLQNGVMLGAFQYFFKTKGLLVTSFLGIWIHGAFEISAIVLAGAAGITAGNGLLFPKSYSRIQAFRISATRGLKIMISLVPFIIIAGFLESFVTRNYQILPEWSKWMLIALSFFIILFYYILYPYYIARKYPELIHQEDVVVDYPRSSYQLFKIRNDYENFKDAIIFYAQNIQNVLPFLFKFIVPIGLIIILIQGYFHYDLMATQHEYDWYIQSKIIFGYGQFIALDYLVGLIWSFIIPLIFARVFWGILKTNQSKQSFLDYLKLKYFQLSIAIAPLFWLLYFTPIEAKSILFFVFPLFIHMVAFIGLTEEKITIKDAFKRSRKHYSSGIFILLFFLVTIAIIVQPIAFINSNHNNYTNEPEVKDLLDLACNFINKVLIFFTDDYIYYSNSFRQLIYFLFVLFTLPFYIYIISLSYFSIREKEEGISLKEALKSFGNRKKNQESL